MPPTPQCKFSLRKNRELHFWPRTAPNGDTEVGGSSMYHTLWTPMHFAFKQLLFGSEAGMAGVYDEEGGFTASLERVCN